MAIRQGLFLALLPAGLLAASGVHAQGVNLFDVITRGLVVGQSKREWDQTDQVIRDCLARHYNIDVSQLAQRGIGPRDRRVMSHMSNCNRIVAAEQEQLLKAQEIEAERQRTEAGQAEVRKQTALVQENARQEAAAAEKATSAKRLAELTAKYGAKLAQAISNHLVLVGMTREQVLDSRGEPGFRQTVPPSDELWRYGGDQVVFTSGRVSYIGH